MILFVNSAAHIALLDVSDQHHRPALDYLNGIQEGLFITSNLVLSEVAARGVRLVGAKPTATYLRAVLSNPAFHAMDVPGNSFGPAIEAMIKYEDQGLGFVDCTTVLIMQAARTRTIFTFDRAFRRLGFHVVP
jgi:predicted nucleic acid-binding protein